MEKRKVLGTIIGVLAFIALIAGISFAWFSWQSSNNTLVSFTVGGVDITFDAGADITSSKLRPVSTKEVGVSKGYAVKKTITASSPLTAYLNLYLTLETLPNGLKHESFIWELYKGSNLVGKGNFKNNNQGDKVRIASSQKITNTTSTYDLYIWIDGNNYANPETMQNQTFKFVLSADATDEEPNYGLITLTNLGLSANEGTPNFNVASTTNEGIFAAEDDLGTSYYFRGAVENNYVKFAGYYWRIIRINGDGTIRMIYDGTTAHANGESSADRQLQNVEFNTNYNDNAYVGYMYGTPGSSTYEATHANINDSTIKTANDAWYKTNIQDKGYGDYVADAIYCSDRQVVSFPEIGFTGNGTGTQKTAYGFYSRVEISPEGMPTNFTPSLKCAQANDRFTTSTSLGNGDLTYPVGLLTIDEANMAGGDIVNMSSNYSYYLYTGDRYWLFSPFAFISDIAGVCYVGDVGSLYTDIVDFSFGLRPVISLKSNIGFSGNGTMNNPFEIS